MKLFIAEKPSLAKAIAEGIGIEKRGDGFISCKNGDCVTWAFGHLLELVDAATYDPKYKIWSFQNLPIMPDSFRKAVKNDSGVKKQINIIKGLIKKSSSIVNAGDPDREGQLLVDEILEDVNNKKKVERIWLASTDSKSVKKALASLKNNDDYQNLKMSAQARSEADWLYGINLTRAMTLSLKGSGGNSVLSIGRVQTPTLALIVNRELQIKNFKPRDFFVCTASFKKDSSLFSARFLPENNDGLGADEQGYLIDEKIAKRATESIKEKATVVSFESKKATTNQPLCYNLSSLQSEASTKLNIGAKQTLDIAQKLYEKGYTSYPRSDCGYLPEEQFSEAKNVLNMLSDVIPIASKADSSIKSPTWNNKKVTAHHGIVPTESSPENMTDSERSLYLLIAKRFIAQFFKPEVYNNLTSFIKDSDEHVWKSTGKEILDAGWKVVYSSNKSSDDEEQQGIPNLKNGESLNCIESKLTNSQTKPPSRFTEGTLIKAMSSVHNFVNNEKYKKMLKETSGIGTEATRANIIETLFKRDFIEKKGKNLIPKPIAIFMIESLTPKMKDPGVTAIWEEYLGMIEKGSLTYEQFITEQKKFIPKFISDIQEITFPDKIVKEIVSKTSNKKPYKKKIYKK